MIKRPMSGKKRYSKKRYSNKINTKKRNTKKRSRRYKKRYSKKNNLKGGLLTQQQHELLRKVAEEGGRKNYCKTKNRRWNRTKGDCDDKKPVCKWDRKEGETRERCMKDTVGISELNNYLYSKDYPPFTKISYRVMGPGGPEGGAQSWNDEVTDIEGLRYLVEDVIARRPLRRPLRRRFGQGPPIGVTAPIDENMLDWIQVYLGGTEGWQPLTKLFPPRLPTIHEHDPGEESVYSNPLASDPGEESVYSNPLASDDP
jgi:hypothetical protein